MEKETVDRSLMYEYDNTSYYQKRSEWKEEYYGLITKVEIRKTPPDINITKIPMYDCILTVASVIDEKLVYLTKTIESVNIYGRGTFEVLISRFHLTERNKNGSSVLYMDKLPGSICEFTLSSDNNNIIDHLEPLRYSVPEDFSNNLSQVEIVPFDNSTLPKLLKYYVCIPSYNRSFDNILWDYYSIEHFIYHGYIEDVILKTDDSINNEQTLILKIFVFFQDKAKIHYMSIRCSEIDRLFSDQEIINEDSSININKLKNRFCRLKFQDILREEFFEDDEGEEDSRVILQIYINYISLIDICNKKVRMQYDHLLKIYRFMELFNDLIPQKSICCCDRDLSDYSKKSVGFDLDFFPPID